LWKFKKETILSWKLFHGKKILKNAKDNNQRQTKIHQVSGKAFEKRTPKHTKTHECSEVNDESIKNR